MPKPMNHDRICKLTPLICGDIAATLLPGKRAAWCHGLPGSTFEWYMGRGRKAYEARREALLAGREPPDETPDEAILCWFWEQVTEARSLGARARLARIAQGKHGWQGSAWILERCLRDEFAPPVRHEVSGPGGGPIQSVSGDEAIAKLEAILARRAGEPTTE